MNYKQYKAIFESFKKKSKKNYYSDLIDSYKYNIKKHVGCYERNYWTQNCHQCPLPNFITVKTEKYSTINKLRKRLIIILLTSVLT